MASIELKGLKALRNLHDLSQTIPITDEQIKKLPVDFLIIGKYQPRKNFNETTLNELAESIRTQGILQPLIVRKVGEEQYEIIVGERRWRAAKKIGLNQVPVIIKEIGDNVALAFGLIENIQRESLNPIEEATAFARFQNEFSMTHLDIAQMVGRSRVSVTNTIRLLSLHEPVRKMLEEGKINMGHARALLMLTPDQQFQLALQIIEKELNVRQAELLATRLKNPQIVADQSVSLVDHNQCDGWAKLLSEKISQKVAVTVNSKGQYKIIIQVNSSDEMDQFIGYIKVD